MNDPRRVAAGLVCIGFEGPLLTPDAKKLIKGGVRNVILFARNAETRKQVSELTREVKRVAGGRALVCVDHEGGGVQRLDAGFTALPDARKVGRIGPDRAREVGATMARELRDVGIEMNLAPVLDVDTNPENPVIGERSFSSEPSDVAACGVAMIESLQSGGVAACGKHFPGHGDTDTDSHSDLPVVTHDIARLQRVELTPFRAAVTAGVAAVMTAHVVYPMLDPVSPATLSTDIIDGLLRRDFGYDGVVVTDDLEMQAIADHHDVGDAAVAAVTAGADLVLCCHRAERQVRVVDALARAIRNETIPADRVASAVRRLDALHEKYVKVPAEETAS